MTTAPQTERSTALVIATALGCAVAVAAGVWIGRDVLPSDAQAAIAVIFLAPAASVPGALAVGVVRPTRARGLFALVANQVALWVSIACFAGLGTLLFGAVMAVPTLLFAALIAWLVGLVAGLFTKS